MGGLSDLAKVGLTVIAAIIMLVAAYMLIKGQYFLSRNTYPVIVHFDSGLGLDDRVAVKMAGTDVGFVYGKPRFNDELGVSEVTIRIQRPYSVYQGTTFILRQEGLLGDRYVEAVHPPLTQDAAIAADAEDWITPVRLKHTELVGPNAYVFSGTREADFADAIADAADVLNAVEIILDEEHLGGAFVELTETMNSSLERINTILDEVGVLVSDEEGYVTDAMENIRATSANFLSMSEELKVASSSLSDLASDPEYAEHIDNLMARLNEVSDNLAQISYEVNNIVSDPQIQQDVKDTVRLTKETMEEARQAVQGFQETLNKVDDTLDDAGDLMGNADSAITEARSKLRQVEAVGEAVDVELGVNVRAVDLDSSRSLDNDDVYVGDLNVAVNYEDTILQVGAENIGEQNDFNFMLGWGDLDGFSVRGGVYRSELGIGAAYDFGGVATEVMLYDTSDPKLNALGRVAVADQLSVVVGVEDIENDPTYTAGLGVDL